MRRTVMAVLAMLLAGGSLVAQQQQQQQQQQQPPQPGEVKPNFSGTWRMVREKSDFGAMTMPDSVLRTIDHKGVTINVHTEQESKGRKSSTDLLYYTDGRESSNEADGKGATYHCFWDGGTLVIRMTTATKKGSAEIREERWTLEPDGNTLTMTSHISIGGFMANFKMVCARVTSK